MTEARETVAQSSKRTEGQGFVEERTQLSNLPAEQKRERANPQNQLTEALSSCQTMSDRDTRDLVVNDLPAEIGGNVKRRDSRNLDVGSIVSTCWLYPNGIEQLIEIVGGYEGNSLPMQEVRRVWSSIAASGGTADRTGSKGLGWRPTSDQMSTRQTPEPGPRESPVVVVSCTLLDRLGENQKRLDAAVKGYIKSEEQVIYCERALAHLGLGELYPERLGNADFWRTARDRMRDLDCPAVAMTECESLRAQFEEALRGARELLKGAGPGLPGPKSKKLWSDLSNGLEAMCKAAGDIAELCEDAARDTLATIAADIRQIFGTTREQPTVAPSINPAAGHR